MSEFAIKTLALAKQGLIKKATVDTLYAKGKLTKAEHDEIIKVFEN